MNAKAVREVESCRRLVAKAAWKAWRMLPMQIRSWIGVEDMISDGMAKAYRLHEQLYDPDRNKFITLLYHDMHKFYIRNYVEWYGAEKRGWEMRIIEVDYYNKRLKKIMKRKVKKLFPIPVMSVQALADMYRDEGVQIEERIHCLSVSADSIVQNMLTECFVVPALVNVYSNASIDLRSEIVSWFWQKKSKLHVNNPRFCRLTTEFKDLCQQQHLAYTDCLHLVRSPKCLDSLSRKIFWLPYDNSCLPVVRKTNIQLIH